MEVTGVAACRVDGAERRRRGAPARAPSVAARPRLRRGRRGRVALVVTEAATNLRQARRRRASCSCAALRERGRGAASRWSRSTAAAACANVAAGAARRLSRPPARRAPASARSRALATSFDVYSQPGQRHRRSSPRSVAPRRAAPPAPLDVGGVGVPCPARRVCGDAWAVRAAAGRDARCSSPTASATARRPRAAVARGGRGVPPTRRARRPRRRRARARRAAADARRRGRGRASSTTASAPSASPASATSRGADRPDGDDAQRRRRTTASSGTTCAAHPGVHLPVAARRAPGHALDGLGTRWTLDGYPGLRAARSRRSSPACSTATSAAGATTRRCVVRRGEAA